MSVTVPEPMSPRGRVERPPARDPVRVPDPPVHGDHHHVAGAAPQLDPLGLADEAPAGEGSQPAE